MRSLPSLLCRETAYTGTTATSALDAESETLVNQALAALLKGNNTTISIAHRLSTIKRSDSVIVLSPDGKVAQQGSYDKLSQDRNGAFTKLMQWQMSGGETSENPTTSRQSPISDEHFDDSEDLEEAMSEGHEDLDEEAARAKSNDGAIPETVIEKSEEHKR